MPLDVAVAPLLLTTLAFYLTRAPLGSRNLSGWTSYPCELSRFIHARLRTRLPFDGRFGRHMPPSVAKLLFTKIQTLRGVLHGNGTLQQFLDNDILIIKQVDLPE